MIMVWVLIWKMSGQVKAHCNMFALQIFFPLNPIFGLLRQEEIKSVVARHLCQHSLKRVWGWSTYLTNSIFSVCCSSIYSCPFFFIYLNLKLMKHAGLGGWESDISTLWKVAGRKRFHVKSFSINNPWIFSQ